AAAALAGPFAKDAAAAVNTATKTVTTTVSGEARYYKLVSGSALTIKSITVQGNNVTLTYQ
ncbi:MAG: hypothetical protein ACKOET_20845, partial [Verrucomicrobiota bacterium]